ncbi:MAG: PIN domain-containing protein [Deferrisomatales bacterium]
MSDSSLSSVDCVFDASAVLAVLQEEPGSERVEGRLPRAAICAVNLSEAAGKMLEIGIPASEAREVLDALGLAVVPFDEQLAWGAAGLRRSTRRLGLSLGDRACLATALALGLPVVTADRAWAELGLPIQVDLIR